MEAGFGAFGKMPSVGDFFRINMPGGFVRLWDGWLQQVLLAGQSAYGTAFDRSYMSAPIWRFSLPAGLAGPEKLTGVLMPSVDRVGRRFPLTLVAPLATPGPAALDHFTDTKLFEQLEAIALDALEDSMTQDKLSAALGAVQPHAMRAVAPLRTSGNTLVLTGAGQTEDLPNTVAAALLDSRAADTSIWTAVLDSGPRMMMCPGLPQGGAAMGLFDLTAPIWQEARPL